MYDLHQLLKPFDIEEQLQRYGKRPKDGGYVLSPSELKKSTSVYSYGVGGGWRNMHFDYHMKEIGKTVYMYDGSISELSRRKHLKGKPHDNFIFKSLYINSINIIEELYFNKHESHTNLTAKMDIEGWEWDVFSKCEDIYFEIFSQISVELHALLPNSRSRQRGGWTFNQKAEALNRLNDKYYLFHIHANNIGEIREGYPDTLEVSYIRKDVLDFTPKPRLAAYPIKNLDIPNSKKKPEPRINWWA